MPEVALSGLPLDYLPSGTATYVENLARCLPDVAPDLDCRLILRYTDPPAGSRRFQRVQTPFHGLRRDRSHWARLDKLAWETWSFPLASRNADLLHSLYFAAPIIAAGPFIVTIHDLIPLVLPGYHRGRASALYARLMQHAVSRAEQIVTVSEYSAEDIVRVLGVRRDRVRVTYEAADRRFDPIVIPGELERLRERYAIPERYVLYIGGAEKRKNIETLVRAWATVAGSFTGEDMRLVIVARFPPPDALYPDIPRLVRDLEVSTSVRLLSGVNECDKPAMYRHALALCFPSSYEGFGLTPLEAMASGTPVIVSRATSLPEVVGDAGILIEPTDIGAWAEAIMTVIDSESVRRGMTRTGLARAALFSWSDTARQTADVYRQVLA
ncbi:MAG: glycosyltransferase family 1 protein [Chloroflexota bacterium]